MATIKSATCERLLHSGLSVTEIVQETGINPSTVNYHAARLGYTNIRNEYDWDAIQDDLDLGVAHRDIRSSYKIPHYAFQRAVETGRITVVSKRVIVTPKRLATLLKTHGADDAENLGLKLFEALS